MEKLMKLPEGWLTFFLAWLMILIAGYAINEADLMAGLDVLVTVGTIAYLSGFLLAKSTFSSRTAVFFTVAYGLFFVGYIIGVRYIDPSLNWSDRLANMIGRQIDWLGKAFGGGTSRDAVIFAIQTSLIFWVLGFSMAWYTFRTLKVWRVILPAGLVLLSVVYNYYGPQPLWLYLVIYILVAFLFISRTYLAEQQSAWAAQVVRYERSITYNFMAGGLILAMVALLGAWTAPPLAANSVVGQAIGGVNTPIRRLQDNWTRLFSSLRSYGTATNDNYSGTLSLGGPRNVGDSLIMDIFVPDQLPYAYWQAVVFESYRDGQWSSPDGERIMIAPDEGPISVPSTQAREAITVTVRNYIPNAGTIYGVPEVIGSDRQMFVTQQVDNRGASLVSAVQSRFVLQQGDFYNTESRLSTATATQLRTAGRDYPDWIDPYLQVPDSITERTVALAEELVTPLNNPYDAAVTVQNFLRQEIEYNDQIEAPPPGVEPIDYVLFDLKEGYCNYYASSMVMMLRSQGIPARMVAGYAAGEFIDDANVYRVRAKDAHTWVEVYFPTFGWIQFEPTSVIPVFVRPDGDSPFSASEPLPNLGADSDVLDREELLPDEGLIEDDAPLGDLNLPENQPFTLANLFSGQNLRIMGAITMVILTGIALYMATRINRRVEADVVQSYDRLGLWARWIGREPQTTQTPYERADSLVQAVPEGRGPIRRLTTQFVHQLFSRSRTPDPTFDPQEEWKVLRPLLLREAAGHQWQRLVKKIRGRVRSIRY